MLYIYDLIEELCIKKGVTVTTLCRDCNIPRSSLTDYKKGRIKSLSADTLCKIADYFDVSVSYICGGAPTGNEEEIAKTVIFGQGVTVTDEMWSELKRYAAYITDYKNKKD